MITTRLKPVQGSSIPRRLTGRPLLLLTLGCLVFGVAARLSAQEAPVVTPLGRQLARIDFSVNGAGSLNSTSSGTTTFPQPTNVTDNPGSTLGALVTVRYTRSAFKGVEFNYGYARFTQKYTSTIITQTNPPTPSPLLQNVQASLNEYTLGYVVHPRLIFGVQPFVSGGGGLVEFKPTRLGGSSLLNQGRPGFYYAFGADKSVLSPHFGVRLQFRQVFYATPDFNANYLAIGKRTSSLEPAFGFYLHF